jgi:two-component system cell cycle response regulator
MRSALGVAADVPLFLVEDDDAVSDSSGPAPIIEPIPFGEQVLGSFALAPCTEGHMHDQLLVKTIARELGAALRMASLVEESRLLATTDALTGLVNRRAFSDWALRELRRSQRYHDPLAVILLDVDHFKQINDRYGHAAGDLVLGAVSRLLMSGIRNCDVVARWGGEEFVLALPSTALEGATEVAERARRRLESASIVTADGQHIPVTASFGVAQLDPQESLEQLIDRADRAMYSAKSSGRNRVESSPNPTGAAA